LEHFRICNHFGDLPLLQQIEKNFNGKELNPPLITSVEIARQACIVLHFSEKGDYAKEKRNM